MRGGRRLRKYAGVIRAALALSAATILVSGCINPIPGGRHNGSVGPLMAADADQGVIFRTEYPGYCHYLISGALIFGQAKISCGGQIELSDDGQALLLVERDKVRVVDMKTGQTNEVDFFRPMQVRRYDRGQTLADRFLLASTHRAVDWQDGSVYELPEVYDEDDQLLPDWQLLRTDDNGQKHYRSDRKHYTLNRASFSASSNLRVDPTTGRTIVMSSRAGRPTAEPRWAPTRFVLDTGLSERPPGPPRSALANLLRQETPRTGTGPGGAKWFVSVYYDEGWTDPITQSADGRYAVWGWADGSSSMHAQRIGLFELNNGEPLWTLTLSDPNKEISFSEDSQLVLLGQRGRSTAGAMFEAYDVRTGTAASYQHVPRTPRFGFGMLSPEAGVKLTPPRWTHGAFSYDTEDKKRYAWYAARRTENHPQGEILIAEAATGEIIYSKALEQEARSSTSMRDVDIALARSAPVVAALSSDGVVRVFRYAEMP